MLKLYFFRTWFSVYLMVLGTGVSSGQEYPNKPIRIITSGAGGDSDLVARVVAQGITVSLGQPVVIDNRTGIIAVEAASKAPPDGYSVLIYGNVIWYEPLLRDNVPWDPVRDFSPITILTSSPNILVVHPSLPVKSVKDLIALAKAKPGELNYASGGVGGSSHLAAELFKAMASVNIIRVNYKGAIPALNALLGGEMQLMFPTATSVTQFVKSGKLRPLAVTSSQPSVLAQGLPTMAASGFPGCESGVMLVTFAPAGTPAPIISRLNQEIVRVVHRADVKEKLFNSGLEAIGSSPEQLATAVKSDMARMGKVIKGVGIRIEKK